MFITSNEDYWPGRIWAAVFEDSGTGAQSNVQDIHRLTEMGIKSFNQNGNSEETKSTFFDIEQIKVIHQLH